jgi:hypothetical protein
MYKHLKCKNKYNSWKNSLFSKGTWFLSIDVVSISYNRLKVSVQNYLYKFYDQLQEKIHDRRGTGSCP